MFTIIGIILSAVIILTITIKSEYTLKNRQEVVKTRINTMNNFIKDVELDLERGLQIIGFNSLLAIEEKISNNGTYIADIDLTFEEAILRGTINDSSVDILINNTFVDWTESIKTESDKIGVDIDLNITNISLIHEEPWAITVQAGIDLDAIDKKGTSRWKRLKNVKTKIDIQGFEDPAYTIESFGRVLVSINKTPFTSFADINDLKEHINRTYYKTSTSAPSFLMRFEGDFSASPFGIESIVNVDKFSSQSLQTYIRSNVDYIYFDNPPHIYCKIQETAGTEFDFLRLDNDLEPLNHLDDYGLNCE